MNGKLEFMRPNVVVEHSLPCAKGGGFCGAKLGGIVIRNAIVITKTIPQSPFGDSSPYTGEPVALPNGTTLNSNLYIYLLTL